MSSWRHHLKPGDEVRVCAADGRFHEAVVLLRRGAVARCRLRGHTDKWDTSVNVVREKDRIFQSRLRGAARLVAKPDLSCLRVWAWGDPAAYPLVARVVGWLGGGGGTLAAVACAARPFCWVIKGLGLRLRVASCVKASVQGSMKIEAGAALASGFGSLVLGHRHLRHHHHRRHREEGGDDGDVGGCGSGSSGGDGYGYGGRGGGGDVSGGGPGRSGSGRTPRRRSPQAARSLVSRTQRMLPAGRCDLYVASTDGSCRTGDVRDMAAGVPLLKRVPLSTNTGRSTDSPSKDSAKYSASMNSAYVHIGMKYFYGA